MSTGDATAENEKKAGIMLTKNNHFTNPWAAFALPALTLLLGVQILRALFPLLLYVLGDYRGWTAVNIGLLALVLFSLSFLANMLWRLSGGHLLLIVSVAGVGVTRLALQLWPDAPLVYLILCIIGTICFVLFFPLYLAALRSLAPAETVRAAYGLQIGFILVVLFNGLYNSYEMNWQPGWLNVLIVIILVVLQLGGLVGMLSRLPATPREADVSFKKGLLWAMIGPFLFLQLLLLVNLAQSAAIAGLTLPAVFILTSLAGLAGLGGVWLVAGKGLGGKEMAVIGVIFWLMSFNPPLVIRLFVLTGQFVLAACLTAVLLHLHQGNGPLANSRQHTIRNLTLGNGIGWVLFVIFIFLYYAGYQIPFPFSNAILPPIATLLVVLAGIGASYRLPKEARQHAPVSRRSLIILVALLATAILLKSITWKTPEPLIPAGGPVRVLVYNLHNGVNPYGQLDLEAVARAIEAENPDVVALQEVSRGWIVNGSVDMLQWLAQRLQMPYVWGETEGLTWGNAVFSRYPILTAETHPLPPHNLLLHRGFILSQIDVGAAEPLHIINSHYHQIEADSDIRVAQTQAILAFWNGRAHTLLVGDLNARPDTPEMALLREAGFTDALDAAGISPGYTYSSLDPDRRLDYIWYTADLTAAGVRITTATASDHLGIVAAIRQ